MSTVVNEASKHFGALFAATRAEIKRMQPSPIGTVPTSPRQQHETWKKMRQLPKPEFNEMMDKLAKDAKHETGETKACDACDFLVKSVLWEKRNAERK